VLKMKKSTKYLIARLVIMALCMVIGFSIGWISKETEVVEVNITRPIVRVNQPIEEPEPTTTYTEMQVIATAYCPCVKCCGKSDGITSTGVKAKANHTIAADPNVLPYGTEILCGMGEFVVEDCGGAIRGNRIDFFFDSHEEALKFGRQEFTIWIKEAK
jgi:3D (Asp-Asp-Asp) domain-containing protein